MIQTTESRPALTDYLRTVRKAKMVVRAFDHKLRQQMLHIIAKKPCNVTSIYVQLRIEQSVASQHLGVLRRAGLVLSEKEGKERIYSINYAGVEKMAAGCKTIIG